MEGWVRPHLTDYWDERVRAIDSAARELSPLGEPERQAALDQIAAAVARHVEALPDELLAKGTVAIVDDLYKAACATDRWDGSLADYLNASAGTFSRLLKERGLTVQYLVDNTWEDMSRPVRLFPDWFGACGFVYACPQKLLLDLIEADHPEAGTDPATLADRYIDEARAVASMLVRSCQEEGRHFVHLETDYVDGSFHADFSRCDAPGVLTVFRNEPAEPGTEVQVWFPEGLGGPA